MCTYTHVYAFNVVEGLTGALRFPAGVIEYYKTKKNPSPHTHAIKFLAHTIRTLNNALALNNNNPEAVAVPLFAVGFEGYGICNEIVSGLNEFIKNIPTEQSQKSTPEETTKIASKNAALEKFLLNHYDDIRGIILPFIEATCAVIHASENLSQKSKIIIFWVGSMVRLSQIVLDSKQDSAQLKILGLLLAANAAYVLFKLLQAHLNSEPKNVLPNVPHAPQPAVPAVLPAPASVEELEPGEEPRPNQCAIALAQ
jgi:hypothetical protein